MSTVEPRVALTTVEFGMIDLYNAETNKLIGSITEADLKVLVDSLEEESEDDQDYYITGATIDVIAGGGALATRAQTRSPLRFAISFPAARSAQPLDGRVLLFISNDGKAEPRTLSVRQLTVRASSCPQ